MAVSNTPLSMQNQDSHSTPGTQPISPTSAGQPMRRVLVTGATGFIGFELAKQLSSLGLHPRLLVRRPQRAALLSSLDAEPVHGDLESPSSLRRAVTGIDTVFHLGARASFESYRRLRPTTVDGSVSLMRAAAAAGVKSFVFASSLFVHGSQDAPIDATTPPDPALGYGRAKQEAEIRLTGLADEAGIALGNIRLPHVYGSHSVLFEQIRRGLAIFPGSMTNQCGHLHVEDAARVLIEAGRQRWRGASPVADRHPADWREFFAIVREMDPRVMFVRLPQWMGYAGAAAAAPMLSLRTRPTLYTAGTVTGFNLNLPVSPDALWKELGTHPRYESVRQGIPAVLDSYIHFRWRHPLFDKS